MIPIESALSPIEPSGQSLESLAARARSRDPRSPERVAADFECIFASMILKEMRQTLEPGSLFGQDSSDSWGGLFDLYMGQQIVRSGGLGLAQMIKKSLEKSNDASASS